MRLTLTADDRNKIVDFLKDRHIPSGLGNKKEACSIAAINLALTGELTDTIPACMSRVIGKWIIRIQDAMPDSMRNSEEWRSLLPLAAGTGRDKEAERLAIIMDWMWTALKGLQPIADDRGFGDTWWAMTTERINFAAYRAYYAADSGMGYAAYHAARAADNAIATSEYSYAASSAAAAAAYIAAEAAGSAAAAAVGTWDRISPAALLRTLVEVGE